eukprot:gene10059-11130_t
MAAAAPLQLTPPAADAASGVAETLSEEKVVLRPELGGGLAVTVAYRRSVSATAIAGAQCVFLVLRNTKETPLRRVRVNFPSDVRRTNTPEIPLLSGGQEFRMPIKMDIRSDQGAYTGLFVVQEWDWMQPLVMDAAEFEAARSRLKGFSEVSKAYTAEQLQLQAVDADQLENEIIRRVLRDVHAYLVQGAGVQEIMLAGSLRKSVASTVGEKVLMTVTTATSTGETSGVTIRLNCEDGVFCSSFFDELKKMMKEFTEDMKHSRWILRFQGQDLALRVLHSLDFLRKCRELSDWFGQTFYFTANPFMLPFPPKHAYEALKLDDKVQDLYHSTPHHRLGIAQEMNEENNNQWQLLHYLEDFRRQFNLLCTNRVFNWPTVPDIVDNTRNMEFFHAMVTVFICCKDSIDRSYSWETKFQGKISTIRGQDENLIGQNNQRIDKELKIPTLESRKPRYSIIKKIQANKQYTTLMKNNKVVMKGDDRKESIFSVIRADEFQSQQQQQQQSLSSSLTQSKKSMEDVNNTNKNSELSEQEDDNHNEKGQTKDKMTMMTMTMKGNDDRRIDESQSLQEGSQSLAEGDSQSHVTLSTTQSPFSSSSSQQQQQSSSSNNNNNNNNNNSSSSHMKKKIEKLMKSNADHKMLLLSSKKKNNNNKRRDENGLLTAASTSSSSILSSSNLNENSNSHLLIGSGSRSSSNNNNNNNNESQTNDRNGMTPQRQPNNKQTLYEKKSLYHPSQRISFTGMQQLIRRETDLNNMKHSPEQLSRLQSLRQSYANKKQNTTMIKPSSTPNLIDNVGFSYQPSPKKLLHSRHDLSVLNSDDENKDDENEQKTGNSNSNNNNIVKTRRKANIIKVPDYHHHHRKGSSSVLSDNNNKSISAQQSKLSLDVITEEHEMKENHHNDDEGIVKSTSRKSIRSSIRSPGKLSPKKDHDSPPTSNLLTKGKSSSSRRSIYKPSQIQANDSLVSTDSDVADESIDEGHLVAKHRPSVVRQRLKAAIDLSASATGDGGDGNGSGGVVHGRGRVARIALPVLKESVNGSSRVIQGIRPGSEGMHRLTKRGSTVTLSTTTTR